MIALLVISLGIHEAAHGWVALQRGDTTARDLGRITLNPIPHIDPFMTIVLPTISFLSTGFIFGGAKPVPVNYYNLRSPLGSSQVITREPSNGGIGSRLKAESSRLNPIAASRIRGPRASRSQIPKYCVAFQHSPKKIASRKFDPGPARATSAMSRRGLRRL